LATERQIAANRLNAQRSTGPRTEAGKANSRRNALKHGLTAEKMLLEYEDATRSTLSMRPFIKNTPR
jgi:hypothetical protein